MNKTIRKLVDMDTTDDRDRLEKLKALLLISMLEVQDGITIISIGDLSWLIEQSGKYLDMTETTVSALIPTSTNANFFDTYCETGSLNIPGLGGKDD